MNDTILVTMNHDPAGAVITVACELDMETCPALQRALVAAADSGAPLHLHLAGVPFMDVTALNLLLRLRRDFQQRAVVLTVSGFQHQPTRLLALTSSWHELDRIPPQEVTVPHVGIVATPASA